MRGPRRRLTVRSHDTTEDSGYGHPRGDVPWCESVSEVAVAGVKWPRSIRWLTNRAGSIALKWVALEVRRGLSCGLR